MSDIGWETFLLWSDHENIKVINEEWESFTRNHPLGIVIDWDAATGPFDDIEESKIQGFKDLLSEKEKGMSRSDQCPENTLLETLEESIIQHLRDDDNLLDMSQFKPRVNHLLEQGREDWGD